MYYSPRMTSGIPALLLIALLSSAQAGESVKPLTINVECVENLSCKYSGADIPVKIRVINKGPREVYMTTKYMQKAGPYVTFQDLSGKHRWYRGVKLADEQLLHEYSRIEAGQSAEIYSKLYSDELDMFARRIGSYDIEVSFEFVSKWGSAAGGRQNFDEIGSVRITAESGMTLRPREKVGAFRSK